MFMIGVFFSQMKFYEIEFSVEMNRMHNEPRQFYLINLKKGITVIKYI